MLHGHHSDSDSDSEPDMFGLNGFETRSVSALMDPWLSEDAVQAPPRPQLLAPPPRRQAPRRQVPQGMPASMVALADVPFKMAPPTVCANESADAVCAIAACDDTDEASSRCYQCAGCLTWVCLYCLREHVLALARLGKAFACCATGGCTTRVPWDELGLFCQDTLQPYREQATAIVNQPVVRAHMAEMMLAWESASKYAAIGREAAAVLSLLPQLGLRGLGCRGGCFRALASETHWAEQQLQTRQQKIATDIGGLRGHRCSTASCLGVVVHGAPYRQCRAGQDCRCPPARCDMCFTPYCFQCEMQHDSTVPCHPADLASAAAIRESCQACSKCGLLCEARNSKTSTTCCTACESLDASVSVSFSRSCSSSHAESPPVQIPRRLAMGKMQKALGTNFTAAWSSIPNDLRHKLGSDSFQHQMVLTVSRINGFRAPKAVDIQQMASQLMHQGPPREFLRELLIDDVAIQLAVGQFQQRMATILEQWIDACSQCMQDPALCTFAKIDIQRAYTEDLLSAVPQPRRKQWRNGRIELVDASSLFSNLQAMECVRQFAAPRARRSTMVFGLEDDL